VTWRWVLLLTSALGSFVLVAGLLAALLAGVALTLPARGTRSSPLRSALGPSGEELSRWGALSAWVTWLRAFLTTSRGLRLARVVAGAAAMPTVLGSSRWRRRAALLTAPGACLRVVQLRDGSWRLVDVAGWPVGDGRARPLLERVCTAADDVQVTVRLNAASPRVASTVYAPLGFQASSGVLRMVRSPRVMTTAAQPASVPQHLP
jgi:hypothetical protein